MADWEQVLDDIINDGNPFSSDDEGLDEPEGVPGGGDLEQQAGPVPQPDVRSTRDILQYMANRRVSLNQLLDDVFFGNPSLYNDPLARNARRKLFEDPTCLTKVLDRILFPPVRARGKAHIAAIQKLETWAINRTIELLRKELAVYARTTTSPATETEVVDEESLKQMTIGNIYKQIEEHAPQLFTVLTAICMGRRQERNKIKDPRFCVAVFINALANQLSQYNNRMQKILCIYFKAKGVPKSCYHLFQHCGVVTSYQWSVTALRNISKAAMAEAARFFELEPCMMMHDNIRLPYPVKHQRLSNLTVTDNGTSITMLRFRDPERARQLLHDTVLWEQKRLEVASLYRSSRMPHLSDNELFTINSFLTQDARVVSNILDFLFEIPGLKDSPKRTHPLLAKLPPVHQLPYGPEFCTWQAMLESVPQEEASYEGNHAIVGIGFKQLKVDTPEKIETWAKKKKLPWMGDNLTVKRLRMLQRMKAEDPSTAGRLGHIIPVFGWFHLEMNLANAIFYHHYAEHSGSGLGRDAAASQRSGLTKPTKNRGPKYHILDEFLQHTTTARMRGLWHWATGTKGREDLIKWVEKSTPRMIRDVAERICSDRVSGRAMAGKRNDPNLCNAIALSRDLMLRHEVRESIRHGDVGRMEDTLPSLLIFFTGAGAKNYASEVAETMHWMRHEAPPGVGELIRDECWLVNTRGRHNSFFPLDLLQELNNNDIKSHGPDARSATWEAHRIWSPALPVFSRVVNQLDEEFHDFYRSRKHYIPDAEEDIKLFMTRHAERKIQDYEPNRLETKKEKRTTDCMSVGRSNIMEKKYLDTLATERNQYFSFGSTLELAKHENTSIKQVLQLMKDEAMASASLDTTTNIDNMIQAVLSETDDASNKDNNNLNYTTEEAERDNEGEPNYEDFRHNMNVCWNI